MSDKDLLQTGTINAIGNTRRGAVSPHGLDLVVSDCPAASLGEGE